MDIIRNAINEEDFTIDCPTCNQQVTFKGNQVGTTVTCTNCNTPIHLKDTNFSSGINEADKILEKFTKDLKKMFK